MFSYQLLAFQVGVLIFHVAPIPVRHNNSSYLRQRQCVVYNMFTYIYIYIEKYSIYISIYFDIYFMYISIYTYVSVSMFLSIYFYQYYLNNTCTNYLYVYIYIVLALNTGLSYFGIPVSRSMCKYTTLLQKLVMDRPSCFLWAFAEVI